MKPLNTYQRVRVGITFPKKGRTKQSMQKECDINNIIGKYQKTGALTHFANRGAEYQDITPVEFHQAMNIVVGAQQLFDELPSTIRKKFGNNPETFLEFVQDPENADDMAHLGLTEKLPPNPDFSAPQSPSDTQTEEPKSESGPD